jgi:hypothetical protein
MAQRDLRHSQKRPNAEPKETYYIAKRDLIHSQKRPNIIGMILGQ